MQVYYSGNVQGVGFRYTVKSVATGFEVTGMVRTLPDGRVHLVAEGARGAGLELFIRDEMVNWNEPKNEFRGFEIAR
jgi:acylphosphatase